MRVRNDGLGCERNFESYFAMIEFRILSVENFEPSKALLDSKKRARKPHTYKNGLTLYGNHHADI